MCDRLMLCFPAVDCFGHSEWTLDKWAENDNDNDDVYDKHDNDDGWLNWPFDSKTIIIFVLRQLISRNASISLFQNGLENLSFYSVFSPKKKKRMFVRKKGLVEVARKWFWVEANRILSMLLIFYYLDTPFCYHGRLWFTFLIQENKKTKPEWLGRKNSVVCGMSQFDHCLRMFTEQDQCW